MIKPQTLTVTAADGRMVPIHPSDAHAPGNLALVLKPGEVIEVANSPGIRRRIRAGDLIEVKAPTGSTPQADMGARQAFRAMKTAPLPKPPVFDDEPEEK